MGRIVLRGLGWKLAIILLVASFLFCACSTTKSNPQRTDPQSYRAGELEVLIYSDRAEMVRALPLSIQLLDGVSVGGQAVQINGYFDRANKRIYSIDSTEILIHEFRHYLEPEWKHR